MFNGDEQAHSGAAVPVTKFAYKLDSVVGVYGCGAPFSFSFLWALHSLEATASSSSPDFRLRRMLLRHFERSAARSSQHRVSMLKSQGEEVG